HHRARDVLAGRRAPLAGTDARFSRQRIARPLGREPLDLDWAGGFYLTTTWGAPIEGVAMRVCLTLAALLATAAVAGLAATQRVAPARTLRIYSSLPLHASRGHEGAQARDALLGARLALAEAGATAG